MIKKILSILTKPEKYSLALISLGSLFLALMESFGIGMLLPIMDLFINQDKIQSSRTFQWLYQFTGISESTTFLCSLTTVVIFLFIFKSVYSVIMQHLQLASIAKIFQRMTKTVLSRYLQKPYAFHIETNSSILIKNVTSEVGNFTTGFLKVLISVIGELLIFFAILLLLLWLYPLTTVVLFASIGCILWVLFLIFKKQIKNYSMLREIHSAKMIQAAQESLNAIKEVKVFDVASMFVNRFSHSAKKYSDSYTNFTSISLVPRYLLEAVLFTAMLSAVLITIFLHIPPADVIPQMVIFGLAALKIIPSTYKIYSNVNHFHFYSNSLDIMYEILNEIPEYRNENKSKTDRKPLLKNGQPIQIEALWFSYESAATPIFQDLSMYIPAKKNIAFVGESGAGKSTLVDILMALLVPTEGRVIYGDTPITDDNIMEYRKRIGYVPQDIILIDDTLEANIAFGITSDKVDSQRIDEVIQISQLDKLIRELPQGIKTVVGELGVKLSGGQKQRIGIARALYHNPEILIMDEATSALDANTEKKISHTIDMLKSKLTVILVAHRLSTIQNADIIYVLDRGKIVDQGKFDELIANSFVFQKIANQQVYDTPLKNAG